MIMLLTGTFHRSLDEKNRLAIPKRLRDAMGHPEKSTAYLAPGTDGSLSLYGEEDFAKLADQLNGSSPNGSDVRAFSRLFYAQAERLEIDRQGRMRVSPELAALASLSKEVVLVGVRDHLEIWDRDAWQSYFSHKQLHYDEIAENAFLEGVTPAPMSVSQTIERPIQPR